MVAALTLTAPSPRLKTILGYFDVLDELREAPIESLYSTVSTRAQFWDIEDPSPQNQILDEAALSSKLDMLQAAVANATPESLQAGPAKFYLISAPGDPSRSIIHEKLQMSVEALERFNSIIGFRGEYRKLYASRACFFSHKFDWTDDQTKNPDALTIFMRCPRNGASLIYVMHLRLSDLSCVALLCGASAPDVHLVRSLCIENANLLREHPLYLLSFIYERRYRNWTYWFTERWSEVIEIETITKLTSAPFAVTVSAERRQALRQTDVLLKEMHRINLELCHCENVIGFSKELGQFFLEMVALVDVSRCRLGLEEISGRRRMGLEDRIRFTIARFDTVQKRLREIKSRLDAQINALNFSFSMMSQKTSQVVIQDSGTMKTIAVLGLAFLPATLITSIWTTDLFSLDRDTSWRVYLGTVIGVTATVFLAWWLYLRVFRTPNNDLQSDNDSTHDV